MTLLPLAHIGHWWTWALYAVPVVVVLYSAIRETIRGRRQRRAGGPPGE
jgi:hypothetical protein